MIHRLVMLAILAFTSHLATAQNSNWRINTGVGVPDFMYVGIGNKFTKKSLINFSFSYFPNSTNTFKVATIEHRYIFRYSKKFNELGKWYFGQKVNCFNEVTGTDLDRSERVKHENIFLGLNIGRHFNLSERFGVSFDLDAIVSIVDEYNYIDTNQRVLDQGGETIILPSSNLMFFFRI